MPIEQKPRKACFFNDRSAYNHRYRQALINQITKDGYSVCSVGWSDRGSLGFCRSLTCFLSSDIRIVSNLKATLLIMVLLPVTRALIVVNGLGRWRSSCFFRGLLLRLMRLNYRKVFAVQNYADYRYFKRHARRLRVSWVPGSGGTCRQTGKQQHLVVVSRPEKFASATASIERFAEVSHLPFEIIGLDSWSFAAEAQCTFRGYLEQADLFAYGAYFFQPKGYGEGIPHSLVDAVCSDMTVFMEKSDLVGFGFYKLNASYKDIWSGFVELESTSELRAKLHTEFVNIEYKKMIRSLFSS